MFFISLSFSRGFFLNLFDLCNWRCFGLARPLQHDWTKVYDLEDYRNPSPATFHHVWSNHQMAAVYILNYCLILPWGGFSVDKHMYALFVNLLYRYILVVKTFSEVIYYLIDSELIVYCYRVYRCNLISELYYIICELLSCRISEYRL